MEKENSSKKDKSFQFLVSLLKKNREVSFILLSAELKKDFEQIKEMISIINKDGLIKTVHPAIGAPYITVK
ncbi:MAG: hypothetical protein PHT91_00900 [Candidatus Nanoarchaeia archaeon]|nr:hypothetical protein [Candidatus Nanoarchaeia archaeon]MDD5054450.1 hypothetical protein [Candidatus Nanoarchaeia archaeon]MDD5499417.1 hypothetical protein [Candidatus Nanoarchaeia archaeon]